MTWRVAYSLETLRNQVNAKFPNRSKASDGTIGDESHQTRDSDHNPWVRARDSEGREIGIVTALDITNDPKNGVNSEALAQALKASRDPRLKYVISNRKIWNPSISDEWRPYNGTNPHDHHCHISVKSDAAHYDSRDQWLAVVNFNGKVEPSAPEVPDLPLLKSGSSGKEVESLRESLVLALKNEENFGPFMEGIIKGFQAENGLTVDGKVGRQTWEKLKQKGVIS